MDAVSKFRCRRCQEVTDDPCGHVEQVHEIPSTMAQVWEQFTLVASDHFTRGPRRERAEREVPTEPLF